jgi:hypothetical protein
MYTKKEDQDSEGTNRRKMKGKDGHENWYHILEKKGKKRTRRVPCR